MEDNKSDKEVLMRKVIKSVKNSNDLSWIIYELSRRYTIMVTEYHVARALNNIYAYKKLSKPVENK